MAALKHGDSVWSIGGGQILAAGQPILDVLDLACIRGDRAIFAGLSFSVPPGGALLLTLLTEGLRDVGEWRLMVYSVLLILIIFFSPNGFIAPLWQRLRATLRGRP